MIVITTTVSPACVCALMRLLFNWKANISVCINLLSSSLTEIAFFGGAGLEFDREDDSLYFVRESAASAEG